MFNEGFASRITYERAREGSVGEVVLSADIKAEIEESALEAIADDGDL